jgi:hypothetical protein
MELWREYWAEKMEKALAERNWGRKASAPPADGSNYQFDVMPDWRDRDRGEFLILKRLHQNDLHKAMSPAYHALRGAGFPVAIGGASDNPRSRSCLWLLYRVTLVPQGWLMTPARPKHLISKIAPAMLPSRALLMTPEGELWEEEGHGTSHDQVIEVGSNAP